MDLQKASVLLQGYHQVKFNSQFCTRNKSYRSQCSLCSDICPVNSVRLTTTGVIIEDCIGCGLCVGACPGQAITLPMVDWFGENLSGASDKIYYHCQKSKGENKTSSCGVTVPCLGAISVEIIVTIAAKFSAVYFYQPQFCAQCEIKNGLPLFKDYLAGAKSLLELFNADNRLIVHSNEVLSGYLFKQEKNQLLNRRNFFNMIAVNVRKVPVALIEAALPDADPAFSLSQPNRRQKLVSAISQLAAQSSGVNPQLLPIISHQIEGPCYLCGACVKLCPAGALRLNEAKPPVFEVNPSWCMSCGLCRNICPQQAIAFSATVDTKDLLSQSFKALTVGETKNCLTCNAAFVGNDFAAVCLRCKFTAFR